MPDLRRRAGTGGVTDAVVVLEALKAAGGAILADDRGDIFALLDAAGARGRVPVLTVSPVRD